MTKFLVLAVLLMSAEAFSGELCPATCNGSKPVTPFDFAKKVKETGDPNTGGPLQSTFKVPSTPNGAPDTEVSSSQFLGEINGFEQWSAKECGQSLNTDGDVLVGVPCNNDAINTRNKNAIVNAHKATGPATPSTPAINQTFEAAKSSDAQTAQTKFVWTRSDGIALHHENCFVDAKFETPGKDIFGVYGSGSFCGNLSASKIPNNQSVMIGAPADTLAKLGGVAKAGVYVFGTDLNIIRVTADMKSPFQKESSRDVHGFLFGASVYNNVVTGKDLAWDYAYTAGTIHKGVSKTFAIGPVPVTVEAGAEGKVGVNFLTRQTSLYANGHVTPYVDTLAYASGAINVVIAKAGVEIVLNPLFKDVLDLYGVEAIVATVLTDIHGNKLYTFKASSHVSLMDSVEALSGQFNLFLSIIRPKFIGWKWKKFTLNLFKWEGIKTSGFLYNKGNFNTPIHDLK